MNYELYYYYYGTAFQKYKMHNWTCIILRCLRSKLRLITIDRETYMLLINASHMLPILTGSHYDRIMCPLTAAEKTLGTVDSLFESLACLKVTTLFLVNFSFSD